MRYDIAKRSFMVEKYHELKSSGMVIKAWKRKFPKNKPPSKSTILDNAERFIKTGSVHSLPPIQSKLNSQRESAKKHLTIVVFTIR